MQKLKIPKHINLQYVNGKLKGKNHDSEQFLELLFEIEEKENCLIELRGVERVTVENEDFESDTEN